MNPYDFSKFLEEIKELDLHQMIKIANTRCRSLENASFGVKGAVKRRQEGSVEFVANLKELLFWLGNGIKPHGLTEGEFQMLRPLCVNLIAKNQLKPEALEVFNRREQP